MEGEPNVSNATFGNSKWNSLDYRKKCFTTLVIFFPLISLPFSMAMPNLVEIQYDVVCKYMDISSEACSSSNEVNHFMARMSNVSVAVATVPTIIMIPFVTALVEKIGLNLGLMFVVSGYGTLLLLIYPLAYWLPPHWNPYRLLIVDFLSSLTAASAWRNFFLLAINELFPEADLRPVYVGRSIGAAAFLGIVGPALGSFISQHISMGIFFLLLSVIYLLFTVAFIVMVELPPLTSERSRDGEIDTHPNANVGVTRLEDENEMENKSEMGWFLKSAITQMGALKIFSFRNQPTVALKVSGLLITLWIALFHNMDVGDQAVFMLYGKQHFDWHQGSMGVLMTLMSLAQLMSSVVIFPLVQKLLLRFYEVRADTVDKIDKIFMIMAVFCNTLGFIVMSYSSTSTVFFIGFYIFGHASLAGVVAKPALLKLVPKDQAPSLITGLSVIERISSTVVPVSLLYIYEETLNTWPSFLFKAQAVLNLGFLVVCYFFISTRKTHIME